MPWLELSLTATMDQHPAVEAALESLGALAITLRDADAETADEEAIFEPGVGETPLWSSLVLQALFEIDTDRHLLAAILALRLPALKPEHMAFRVVEDQDWERVWMDRFQPMRFGKRLWVYPWNIEPPTDADNVIVRLDPGLAFGTGTHPTTALCLEWLDGLELDGRTVIDYGCGSGVLAIAALKLGAERAIGVDNDAQALTASRDNAVRNGVGERLQLFLPHEVPEITTDVFVANILAGPLAELAPRFAALAKPGAPFALSGILDGQHSELLVRYGEWFEQLRADRREDWIRISGRRRSVAG